jgi:metallophosphoesterase (TIGR00282 family)
VNILYIGDVMGEPGIETVEQVLPGLIKENSIDIVIAQGENVSEGKGMLPEDMSRLQELGVDFFTGGNHTPRRPELSELLEDENAPVIGPANMPNCPGRGWKYFIKNDTKILVICLLGDTFSSAHQSPDKENPWQLIDKILAENSEAKRDATIVDFHGDYSSEKRGIGFYLDGRATLVVGDHWHVPTADAAILPNGTAHITDVGMCGSLHSSLGVKFDSVIPRWRDNIQTKNELETEGPRQFNAVLVEIDTKTHKAKSITQIQKIL